MSFRQTKPQILRDGLTCASDGAVTGTAFHMLPDRKLVLFIATSHLVMSIVIREKEIERRVCFIDDVTVSSLTVHLGFRIFWTKRAAGTIVGECLMGPWIISLLSPKET